MATRVFLKLRRKPARDVLGDAEVLHHQGDLLVLHWAYDFSDLVEGEHAADELAVGLGADLLCTHKDPRGILLTPSSLSPIQAPDYASGVLACSPVGIWVRNLAREPGQRLIAGEESEIPLPRFAGARRLEFGVIKTARAMQELELTETPHRTLRLELSTGASPHEVSAFYLPLLKAQGFRVRRRVWSSGLAERLLGTSREFLAFVHAQRRNANETIIQISWVVRAG